ncbi:two-component system activity regulator YycH [Radiobacillus kanasensis]|uniref:YycH family regulatory protein n=1 Tax=Radiobacillus kanasensis TaxID=2844358 RepID=UPI001E2A0343|nr:two-component system activity regulator YycH [Radiobacillus kanasensis]UFT99391.1 two-component system activity regulator YycH [Radiobacillus kanasensis]
MNVETIKSIVLSSLIVLSLILTFGIWNQKPSKDVMDEDRFIETEIGGIEETKKSLIEPRQIIMEVNGKHFGLKSKTEEDQFYEYMHEWSLFEIETMEDSSIPDQENQVEVVFPVSLPFQIIKDLFIVDEAENLGAFTGEFDRMYILPNNNQGNVVIQFVDTKTNNKIKANIQNVTGVRDRLKDFRENKELIEYVAHLDSDESPYIYVPRENVTLSRSTFTVSKTDPNPYLINALFNDPSVVRESNPSGLPSEQVYTDYFRELRRYEYYMRFTDPKYAETDPMEETDLINQSLLYVNKHHGWTTGEVDEYVLDSLETYPNKVTYRLNYMEYPVFDRHKNLATIDVIMRGSPDGQGVYQYNRPLIELKDSIGGPGPTELRSGMEVLTYINNNRNQFGSNIQDITIGYQMEQTGEQDVFKLTPDWFILDSLGWRKINFKDSVKGGLENAVGTN